MPRPAPVRRLLGVVLALALLASASPAAAEPTPSPTPIPTTIPTMSPSTSARSAEPTPTPTAQRTTRTVSRASLTRRLETTLDRPPRPGNGDRLRALAEWDGQPIAIVFAHCAAETGTTTAEAAYLVLDATEATSVEWTVTGQAGEVDSGTAPFEDGAAFFDIAQLTAGDFTLTVTELGVPERGASQEFTVLRCVTTTVSCKAVTFVNPAGNPEVVVIYGRPDGPGVDGEDFEVIRLAPGATDTARTALSAIAWVGIAANNFDNEDGDDFAVAFAGEVDSLAIPTDCDRPLSTLSVSCLDGRPRLTVTFAREGSDQPVDFTVTNRKGKIVAQGNPKGSRSTASARLPGPGRYTYSSYFESKAYESLPVEIHSCGAAAPAPAGDTLPDTGPPPLLPLPFGVAFLAAGAFLLTRRTRPARRAAPHRPPPARGR